MAIDMKKESILVVDDSITTLEVLQRNLSSKGYRVYKASGVQAALEILAQFPVDLVITDMKMPENNGLQLVRHIKENYKMIEVMIITGYATVEGAVEAVKTGAEEYLSKPFTDQELFSAVYRVFDKLHLKRAMNQSKTNYISCHGLIGESKAIKKIISIIGRAAQTRATVLITGESGTGKELVARAIHYNSSRVQAPFVPVNCGAIPQDLMESSLFGHLKGAFTGATESRAGFFQTADGGTIFLDEISNTTPIMQAKLLRVLQDKEIYMVGSSKGRKVDVRIVAATNKDLQKLISKGVFREDLFYRLNVIPINVPPLREREDDILLIAHYFLSKFSKELGISPPNFSSSAIEILKKYSWPGNVRELENLMQQLVVMNDSPLIDVVDLPPHIHFSRKTNITIHKTLQEVEIEHIKRVLESVGGNKTAAAEILEIDRKTLRLKLKNR